MIKRWFYKTTDRIPVIGDIPLGRIGNKNYKIVGVNGGLNSETGHVFINYNFVSIYSPFFWELHFHEFLHRIFWVLGWSKMHKVLDAVNTLVFRQAIVKEVKQRELKWNLT